MQQVLGFSALQGGFAWATSGDRVDALRRLPQALVTKISAKLVMAFGMTVLGVGIFWTAQAPVHGHFLGDLFGPFLVAVGMGTAFTFIPIQIAALAASQNVKPASHQGSIYTSQELGGALGIAIASSIAASHYTTLARGGDTIRAALTGGFRSALWVCGRHRAAGDPGHVPADPQRRERKGSRSHPLTDPQPEPATWPPAPQPQPNHKTGVNNAPHDWSPTPSSQDGKRRTPPWCGPSSRSSNRHDRRIALRGLLPPGLAPIHTPVHRRGQLIGRASPGPFNAFVAGAEEFTNSRRPSHSPN